MIIQIKLEKRTEGEREAYAEGYAAGKRDAVKHGRWLSVEPAPYNLFYATCSVCGDRQTIEVANYCPMCGASMDEVEK